MSSKIKPRADGQYMLQILLPPHRGKLFVDHIADIQESLDGTIISHLKPSAFIREMVFGYLEKNVPEKEYLHALDKDEDNWGRIVRNRAEGKALARKLKKQKDSTTFSNNDIY